MAQPPAGDGRRDVSGPALTSNHLLLDGHRQDAQHLLFQAALKLKARLGQGRLQVMAVKAVVFRVQKEPPGQEVLIELGVKLLQEVNAAGLEHPGDFP